ncbi:MAG: DUF1592 domain-containing protein [Planctomycetota bacterium]
MSLNLSWQSGRSRRGTAAVLLALIFIVSDAHSGESPQRATMPVQHRELFERHCFDCHDSATAEAMVDLEGLSLDVSRDIETAEKWAKVLNAINSGEMPPPDAQPLPDEHKKAFLKDLSEQMVLARRILSDTGGVITLRRLNRREYANTIEALLGVRPDVSNLPNDQASSGFDTQGASLFMSSDQIEQYLAAARNALELAFSPRATPDATTIRVEPEEEYQERYATAAAEMRDVRDRATAFLNQDAKPASEFGFLDEYQAKKQSKVEWLPRMDDYLNRPETKHGATLIMTIKQGGYTRIKLPVLRELQDGRYTIRVRAAAYPDARERLRYLEFTTTSEAGVQRLGWRKVNAPLSDPEVVEFPYVHRAGEKKQLVIHQRSHQDRADKNQNTIDMKANGIGTPPGLWVDWAELIGPEPDDRRDTVLRRWLPEKPESSSEKQYATSVLTRFARAAFRDKEPDAEYVDRLVGHYLEQRESSQQPFDAFLDPMSIVLSSPSFLYMLEDAPETKAEPLSGRELAVRLSYFLWSAPPDDKLMQLGITGALLNDTVLREQTERLLRDRRSDEFVRGFVHQWLHMDRLGMFQFDGVQFPTFDNAARELAGEEIFQTFRVVLDEGMPLDTLLKADFIVINDLLAGYYGVAGVEGHYFRKVAVPAGSPRGGLLGTAAVHAMGSDGQRSSPVERGAWVLRKLLHDPPPPAPPNVPMLSRLDGDVYSARELAQAHQEQPQCANCHQKIDPIGFGLENFDAVGLWRDREVLDKRGKFGARVRLADFEIDPSGQLPNGTVFQDYSELREAVALHSEDFARGFTEALIGYGLGRPYGFTDQELSDAMLAEAARHDTSVDAFVHALVQSEVFCAK